MFPCISSPWCPEPDPSDDISARRVQLLNTETFTGQVRVCVCVRTRAFMLYRHVDRFACCRYGFNFLWHFFSIVQHHPLWSSAATAARSRPRQCWDSWLASWELHLKNIKCMNVFKSRRSDLHLPVLVVFRRSTWTQSEVETNLCLVQVCGCVLIKTSEKGPKFNQRI